jgi:DNA helicase II / ATP-dependent DNA helicase PcrA
LTPNFSAKVAVSAILLLNIIEQDFKIMIDLSTLNPEQRHVVETIQGPLLVLAGAGTGKTKAITMRMAYMISMGVAPESIAAMTFTNKAAREMVARLEAVIGEKVASKVRLGTFHSFCLHILREFGDQIGLHKKFSLAGTGDQIDLLRRALQEENALASVNVEALHAEISKAKNALLHPADFARRAIHVAIGVNPELMVKAYELYERQLKLNRMIDFDDCIFKTVYLLEEFPEVRAKLEKRFRYYMIDEFQDTNAAQMKILELLCVGHNNICAVGDDDQSIYSWRGALFETLERFENMFVGTKLIKLEQNYRCTTVILDAANAVIKNNTKRKEKTLWGANEGDSPIEVSTHPSDEEEARAIGDKCMSLLGEGFRAADLAVLYRANNQARAIEMALRESDIPYETFGGSSFFEKKEVKDFLGYVRLLARPDDRLAFHRVINTPNRGIGLKSLEKIEEGTKRKQASPWSVAKNYPSDLGLTGKSLEGLNQFVADVDELRTWSLSSPEELATLGNEIIKRFHLAQDIRAHVKDTASQERKIEALRSLPQWLAGAAKDVLKSKGDLDIHDLLDRLTLNDRDFSDRDEAGRPNRVSLMTIHASKGLEFPVVFVCGLEEDLFPHKNSASSSHGVMEERRLFYVAVTRAKKRLLLSWAAERGVGVMKTLRLPSRFLSELPAGSFVANQTQANTAARVEERKENTVSVLKSLRANLKTRPTATS